MRRTSRAGRSRAAALAAAALCVLALALASGCGLQTDAANRSLETAAAHQQEAEAIIARFKAFPHEWEAIFNVPRVGGEQITKARELLKAKEQDMTALDTALEEWRKDLAGILELNVEQKIKEYVRLKSNAIKAWQDYSTLYLQPLMSAYGGIVETIAVGGPYSEQEAKAQELTGLVAESVQKLSECRALEKKAEDYFRENRLGE